MQELNQIIIKNIRRIREEKKISQKEAGEIIGVDQSQYSKYERGKQSMTIEQLCQLLKWYEIDLKILMDD